MLTENQILDQIAKSTPLGMMIVLLTNMACFAIGYSLGKSHNPSSMNKMISIILAIVAISEIAVAFFLKKKLLEPLFANSPEADSKIMAITMQKTTIVLSALCASPAIYGLVAVILGAKPEFLAGFIIISLAGYLLLHLRLRDFERLIAPH